MSLKKMLIERNIVKVRGKDEEPFMLNEIGTKSRVFFDIKEASLSPKVLNRIIYDMIQVITNDIPNLAMTHAHLSDSHLFLFDKIASVAVGGVPIATALSLETGVPQIIVRNDSHDRGTKDKVIGSCKRQKVLFIEDVSVTGNSIINGVKAIRDYGGICDICIVVVDREEGAEQICQDNNIKLYSLLKKSDFGIKEEL